MRPVLFLLLCHCLYAAEPLVQIPQVAVEREIIMGDWLVIGPWTAPRGKPALDVDFLAPAGTVEAKLSGTAVVDLLHDARISAQQLRNVKGQEFVEFGRVFGVLPAAGIEEAAGYALCLLHSESEREVWLMLGSDAKALVWLNGELRYANRTSRTLKQYHDAIPLPLHKGDNLLLIKAVNVEQSWTITAKLEPTREAAARTALELMDGFFRQALVRPGQPLEMFVRAMPENAVLEGSVERYNGTGIRVGRIGPKAPLATDGLPEGLYRLVRPEGGPWSRPAFYVGSFESLYQTMAARCAAVTADDRTAINLHALVRRLEILKDAAHPVNLRPDDPAWSRRALGEDLEYKAVYAATELEEILHWMELGKEPFRHRPGLHVRGFRSKIDDQPMYYRVFVPSSYRHDIGPGVPLFIMPQPVMSTNRPFLESAFLARQREAEDWARAAEKLGVAILWPGYRVSPYGNPIDFAHFEEALAAVRADYHIDSSRIYIHGYCSTGFFTAMEVLRHPQRYAAVAMVNPVLHRLKGRYDEREEFKPVLTYQIWLRETDPMEAFGAMRTLPLWIIHDDVDPDHGPLSHTIELVERLRAIGAHPRLDHYRNPPPGPLRIRLMHEQLAWLCEHSRTDISDALRGGDTKATVAEALSERFVIVRGTGGSAIEQAAAKRWSDEFAAAWQRTTFVPCRVIDDTHLSDREEQESNLVLIGNADTNMVWKRLAAKIPLKITRESIAITDQNYQGRGLSIEAVLANPDHVERKLVVIGSTDPAAILGTQELVLDGWFTYAIWGSDSAKPRLLVAERRNEIEPVRDDAAIAFLPD